LSFYQITWKIKMRLTNPYRQMISAKVNNFLICLIKKISEKVLHMLMNNYVACCQQKYIY